MTASAHPPAGMAGSLVPDFRPEAPGGEETSKLQRPGATRVCSSQDCSYFQAGTCLRATWRRAGLGGEGWQSGQKVAMRKVSPRPTWAMFAISGLAVWLIDNWPPHKSICFLLIFIPAGDTSTVPSFPRTKGAKQKECIAGPWEPHFLNPRGLWAGRKARTGRAECRSRRVPGPKSRRRRCRMD